jgi:hypothetical protein
MTTAIIGIVTVYIFVLIGKELGGKTFAIIMGILAGTSIQLIARSLMLGQHTFISTFAALLALFILLFWRTKKQMFAFMAGFSLGLAINFHYQAINLLVFFPAIFFIPSIKFKDKLAAILVMFIGLLIPLSPLLYWDSYQSFANMRNLLDYLLIAQERLYVPNSWQIFIFTFLPGYWSFVVGKYQSIAFVTSILSFGLFFYLLLRLKISSKIALFVFVFLLLLVLNRYYRGERSEGYLLYFIPFILILTSWFCTILIESKSKITKFFGAGFLAVLVVGNTVGIVQTINNKSPFNLFREASKELYKKYPDKKFEIYGYKYLQYSVGMPMSLILSFDNKQAIGGKKIGISCFGGPCPKDNPPIIVKHPILIVDLDRVNAKDLGSKNKNWINVNRENVYNDLTGWLNEHQLKSSFYLDDYIKNKIGI